MNELFLEFKGILVEHLGKYPLMQPQDVYKLAYQFSFGPGHFFIDEKEAHDRIFNELKEIENIDNIETGLIFVGNDYARYPIVNEPEYLENLYKIFIKTVKAGSPNNVNFPELLIHIIGYIKDLKTDFSFKDFLMFVQKMKDENYPMVSHSEKYHKAYHPHYRLIKMNV